MRTVKFYRTRAGDCPVEEFLDSLSSKQAQKVVWVSRLIEKLDRVPTQCLKKLVNTEDVLEVRTQVRNNIFHLLGFFDGKNLLILSSGLARSQAPGLGT